MGRDHVLDFISDGEHLANLTPGLTEQCRHWKDKSDAPAVVDQAIGQDRE